jgi:hypothetical protein
LTINGQSSYVGHGKGDAERGDGHEDRVYRWGKKIIYLANIKVTSGEVKHDCFLATEGVEKDRASTK